MLKLVGQAEKEAIRWMEKAAEAAKMSMCLRSKCGAVIVQDGEIIGSGYNAPPLDDRKNSDCSKDSCCVHAEWRAIINALWANSHELAGSTLYFTRVDGDGNIIKSGKPYCTVCSRLILDNNISKFVLWHEEGIVEYEAVEYNKLSYEGRN